MNFFEVIDKYPKKRPPLPKGIKKIFNKHYLNNRQNLLSQLSEIWLHSSMDDRKSKKKTLEIGAGTLNHLPYEDNNKIYDIIEPKKFLIDSSKYKKKINKSFSNLRGCKKNYYDRIISCAVLEHLTNLPKFLYESSFKINKKGYQQHSVPCEGYPFWNISWFLFNALIFRIKYGFDFKYIAKHEHVNNLDEIIILIKFFYKKVKIKYSYPFFNKYFSFYANIKFSNPNKKNINKYLKYKSKKKF